MAKTAAARKTRSPLKVLLKLFIWVFIAVLVAGPSLLHSKAGISISPILTGSMRPYANPGDVFITKQVKATDLKVGDIISVHSQATGVFYAHRIAKITTQAGQLRVVTKGDANQLPEVDPFMVSPQAKVSKEFLRVKWLGRPIIYLTSIQGRQAGLSLMVFANVVGLFMFLFRKKVTDHNPFHLQVYKDLYAEAHTAHLMRSKELKVFKDLFETSIEDKRALEDELAAMEMQLKETQLAK